MSEDIDGRPLYRYRVSLESQDLRDLRSIAIRELQLKAPKMPDHKLVEHLALVAAARFASNYNGGDLTWNDCGEVVAKLRSLNIARFGQLMQRSLEYYRRPIMRARDGRLMLLETVAGEAGLPAAMLGPHTPIRGILDKLMTSLVKDEDNLLGVARDLFEQAIDVGSLVRRFQVDHMPELCVELVRSIVDLAVEATWTGGALDPIWAIPDWDEKLPFRVDEQAARGIVAQLLDVAVVASGSDGTGVERILRRNGGRWQLVTRVAVAAGGLDLSALNIQQAPSLAAVHYMVNDQPFEEAFRVRSNDEGKYVLARGPEEIVEGHGAWSAEIGLVLRHAGTSMPLVSAGGEALDAGSAWVFEPRNGEHVFKSLAPVRLRSKELLLLVEEGMSIAGAAQKLDGVSVELGEGVTPRALWRVTGKAEIGRPGEESTWVEAGYDGPQSYLDFKGKTLSSFQVRGACNVFVGHPYPRRVGGFSGQVQWRRQGEAQWQNPPNVYPPGLLAFRLIDEKGNVLAERRRILVLPEDFRPEVTTRFVRMRLPKSFAVAGVGTDGAGFSQLSFGNAAQIEARVQMSNGEFALVFSKPSQGSFIDLLSREQYIGVQKVLSSRAIERMCAISGHGAKAVDVMRSQDAKNSYPLALDGTGRLNLYEVRGFLSALAFESRARPHTLRIEFQNAVSINVNSHLSRIQRNGWELLVAEARPETELVLKPLVAATSEHAEDLVPTRKTGDTWVIPDLRDKAPLYLAVDKSRQAYPCLVVGVAPQQEDAETFMGIVTMKDEALRSEAMMNLYRRIVADPHEGRNQAELATCMSWISDFQMQLEWLDPFLILTRDLETAIRLLVLAEVNGHDEAASSLCEAFGKVPFFWHRLTNPALSDLVAWTASTLGSVGVEQVLELLQRLPIAQQLRRASSPENSGYLRAWQDVAAQYPWPTVHDEEQRQNSMADFVEALWSHPSLSEPMRRGLYIRPKFLSIDVNLAKTYFFAPYELALAHVFGIDLNEQQQGDFIYARYVIDPEKFDAAYCEAIKLMEVSRPVVEPQDSHHH